MNYNNKFGEQNQVEKRFKFTGPPYPLPEGYIPSAAEMHLFDIRPKEYWCEPLVPKNSKIQLSGLPKHGKGHLVELLGLCLSEGRDFLGFHCQRCSVVYLEFEDTDADLKDRVDLKRQYLQVSGDRFRYRHYPLPLYLDITKKEPGYDSIAELRQIVTDLPVDVVILDPRIKLMKGEADKVFGIWTTSVSQLIEEFGISLVVVHHEGKCEYAEVEKRGLGSIKYNAWFDVIMSLTAEKDGEGKITAGELQYTGKIEPGKLKLAFDPAYFVWSLAPEVERHLKTKYEKAKDLIHRMYGSEEAVIKRQALSEGIGHTTFHKAIRDLLNEGKIRSVPIDRNKRRIISADAPF